MASDHQFPGESAVIPSTSAPIGNSDGPARKRKVSPTQQRVLSKIDAGCDLIRSFDVYGGYWWWLMPTQERVAKATVEAIVRDGHLREGENKRIHTGYHEMRYIRVQSPCPS